MSDLEEYVPSCSDVESDAVIESGDEHCFYPRRKARSRRQEDILSTDSERSSDGSDHGSDLEDFIVSDEDLSETDHSDSEPYSPPYEPIAEEEVRGVKRYMSFIDKLEEKYGLKRGSRNRKRKGEPDGTETGVTKCVVPPHKKRK